MLRLPRITVVAAVAAIIVAGVQVPAWADPEFDGGNAQCDASGCTAEAESGQSSPGSSGSDLDGESGATGDDGAATADAEPSECDLDPTCDTITQPGTDEEDAPEVDPVEVAHEARDSLALPDPQISTSPGPEVPVLVQVPVWLWIDEDAWQDQEATAEVPGGEVTVTASPSQTQWSMGDGSSVTCDGPGVAYDPDEHDPAAESPECGHTYTRASTTQVDGAYALEVDITWEVSWSSSDGDGGDLDALVTSASTERTVIESHGLVTGVD